MKRFTQIIFILTCLLGLNSGLGTTPHLYAEGGIDFEAGVDGQPINTLLNGVQFTTTAGYDWLYGDWRTDNYATTYGSNGNFFAWLGPNQQTGRLDFPNGCATYLQTGVSSATGLLAQGYTATGELVAEAKVPATLNSKEMAQLQLESANGNCFSHVILSSTGGNWLIDDIQTNAELHTRQASQTPVVVIHGITGSYLRNDDQCGGGDSEIWVNLALTALDPFDFHLNHLKLASDGASPASSCDSIYPAGTIRELGVWPAEFGVYGPLIDHLEEAGFTVYDYAYDWRLDLRYTADEFDAVVDTILAETGASQVSIVDHSMGGLVARQYVTANSNRADKIEQVISLGSPFLGAPKTINALRWGDLAGFLGSLALYPDRLEAVAQNMPTMYQLLPAQRYFNVYNGGYYRYDDVLKTLPQTRALLQSDHNGSLAQDAEAFRTVAIEDWANTPLDVPFRLIVGSALPTPGVLHEYPLFTWWGWSVITWEVENINGDGTVPLHSADLQGNGYNYAGNTPILYAEEVDHLGLVKTDWIMDYIVATLSTTPNTVALKNVEQQTNKTTNAPTLYVGSAKNFATPKHTDTLPPAPANLSTKPGTVNATEITLFGDVELHVYDEAGLHTGPRQGNHPELGIAGSSYVAAGQTTLVTLPADGNYKIDVTPAPVVEGEQVKRFDNPRFDLRIRELRGLDGNLTQQTIFYGDINLSQTGRATLAYNESKTANAPALALQADGRTVSEYIAPLSQVTGKASADTIRPEVNVELQKGFRGVLVTIKASDADSGVAAVRYSTDLGQTIHDYTKPFTVSLEELDNLVVQVTDMAGNKASAKAK